MNKVLLDLARLDFPLLRKVRPLFDDEFGLFGKLNATKHNFFGRTGYVAILHLQDGSLGEHADEGRLSQGAGFSLIDACRCALGEALERTSGGGYDRADMLFGSFAELTPAHRLLDPDEIPNFLPDQPLQGPIVPLTRETLLWWTRMRELTTNEEMWVPAYAVYMPYKIDRLRGEPWVDFSTSTGLACGDTPEQATLSALLEIVERDAFTLAWVLKRECPASDPAHYADFAPWFECLSARVLTRDITTELGIPVAVSYVIREPGARPALVVGAGAALTRARATEKAVIEVAGCYNYGHVIANSGETPIVDPSAIAGFKDHAKYWVHHEDPETVAWLERQGPARTPPRDFSGLDDLIETFRKHGKRIFYRELTSPLYREHGLAVVRCYSPDLQPLYVRNGNIHMRSRRLQEFARLVLGRELRSDDLNLTPHPFP